MKRADVQIGVEYAVRRGSAGQFARVLIRAEKTAKVRGGYGRIGASTLRSERGFEGKVIEPWMWGEFSKKGAVVFVRSRDISHEWTVEAARRENDARLEAERGAEKRADESERRVLIAKAKALGIDLGLRILLDDYRYRERDTHLRIRREAIAELIAKAEPDG